MKKCLLWGTGDCFNKNVNLVRYYELLGQFEVIGVTSNSTMYSEILGYKFIRKMELDKSIFDFVLIMAEGAKVLEIYREIEKLGVQREEYFTFKILQLPNFDLEKYLSIRQNPPSLFASNCWGGVTYHSLELEFESPLINLVLSEEDYLKLLSEPKKYMEAELEYVENDYVYLCKRHIPSHDAGIY